MFSVWLIMADNSRQQCGREMMQQSEAEVLAIELRQMGYAILIEKWEV